MLPGGRFTLIQGTALAQLNVSPGHVPGTQWPGQLGNFAVAGHRVTAGNPFWSLPSLKDGDLVYVETRLNDYTYRVIGKKWVAPTDTSVQVPLTALTLTTPPAPPGPYVVRVMVNGALSQGTAPFQLT